MAGSIPALGTMAQYQLFLGGFLKLPPGSFVRRCWVNPANGDNMEQRLEILEHDAEKRWSKMRFHLTRPLHVEMYPDTWWIDNWFTWESLGVEEDERRRWKNNAMCFEAPEEAPEEAPPADSDQEPTQFSLVRELMAAGTFKNTGKET